MSIVLQLMPILSTALQWELCCAGLSKSDDVHVVSGTQACSQHRWLYSAIAERASSVRVERKGNNFHLPQAAKSFE